MKTLNITLNIEPETINDLESFLRKRFNVIDVKILPNTTKMYEEDETYRKLVKGIKKSNLIKDRYINDHNHKYQSTDATH